MPELLILGGLTVDHFADGRTAPGGSVIHSGLAAAAEGVRPTLLTVAGDEPEARAGRNRLRTFGEVIAQRAPRTTTFAHRDDGGRRVLTLEASTDPIVAPGALHPHDVLLAAPIGDELPPATVARVRGMVRPRSTVMLIQGWLRRLAVGHAVHPLPLDELGEDHWACFAAADAIVVSTEDLAERPEDPFAQAALLRHRVGSRPIIALTLGPHGYLLDDPNAERIIAAVPRRIVDGVPTVGAGDTFGAALAIHLARGDDPVAAAEIATDRVIALLDGRSATPGAVS
jgi:sugar/nucleoside kinase (ribokinase family)